MSLTLLGAADMQSTIELFSPFPAASTFKFSVSGDQSKGGNYAFFTNSRVEPCSGGGRMGYWLYHSGTFGDNRVRLGSLWSSHPITGEPQYEVANISWEQGMGVYVQLAGGDPPVLVDVDGINDAATGLAKLRRWTHIGIELRGHPGSFVAILHVDGVEVLNYSGIGDGTYPAAFTFMLSSPASTLLQGYVDDIYSAEEADFAGDAPPSPQYFMVLPEGAGYSTQWTPFSGDNYANVDENTAPDNDASYVQTTGAGKIDAYALVDLTLPANYVVDGNAWIQALWRRDEDDCAYTPMLLLAYDGLAVQASEQSYWNLDADAYRFFRGKAAGPPSGGVWGLANFNAAQFGYESFDAPDSEDCLPSSQDTWISPVSVVDICEVTNSDQLINGVLTDGWSHTTGHTTHYMEFDLGDRYLVQDVRSHRISQTAFWDFIDADMYVSEDGVDWGTAVMTGAAIPDSGTGWMDWDMTPTPTAGRYVRLEFHKDSPLSITEIEFYV